ncbi:hypothetical protein LAZ40_01485 [Cereibacter sphaeroides]|uniref:hypothetical protein n=1 Tax=Cereibacter sphaeroides TaxID=1063 RepID=UPI001F17BD86|nr:hypothetical protein [Cereibacter sphaeroides]MCE6957732.1 hypothetical protein [Cereibacter sphaeroides]MCE6971518.1 hypothetical protein [Cereibacter sphaeroides]
MTGIPVLYHGTTPEAAAALLRDGWRPHAGSVGGNCGQTRFLYLTNDPLNALWFSEEKGARCVLAVTGLAPGDLKVDPEDGIGETVTDEVSGDLPGSVVLWRPVCPQAFSLHPLSPTVPLPGYS